MIIKNPINQDLTVKIFGVTYTVPAKGTLSGVTEQVATYWRNRLHNFISIDNETKDTKNEKVEEVKEEAVETTETTEAIEVVEEVKEIKKVDKVKKNK